MSGVQQDQTQWGFEPARLEAFLRQRLPNLQGVMHLQAIGGGQSNPHIFCVV